MFKTVFSGILSVKSSPTLKILAVVLFVLLVVWLLFLGSSFSLPDFQQVHSCLTPKKNELNLLNGSASNFSYPGLAYTLHKTYSTLTMNAVQKYPLYFSLEKERLEKLYDSIKGKKTVKRFLNYGKRTIFTPMNFSYCHASECDVISDMAKWQEADAVILTEDKLPNGVRPQGQLWFTLIHESPVHISIASQLKNEVNFTISFRFDSTIHSPYGYYEPYIETHGSNTRYPLPSRNFAAGRTKKVAWFVSNCVPKSPRMVYAIELSRYISVDIYGRCGTMVCPKNMGTFASTPECLTVIRENYKFYLSFENSLCSEYITEKLYRNALSNDILPVVMGASIEEYERVSPPYSFIHVDQFESPEKLAKYLLYLDKNDTAYNEYFACMAMVLFMTGIPSLNALCVY
ncbi:unnamed protein product [Heterobilharzia americana]|nr:unnamed protein product [Heterobilharzia americana]